MKKLLLISILVFTVLNCKKTEFAAEGPTDVRVRNLSDQNFEEVVVSTSENAGDTIAFGTITNQSVSDYFRFTKAYPKAEISAKINIGGTLTEFTTGSVSYTYMNYQGQVRLTYEVWISDFNNRKLEINNLVLDEALVLE
ncbi:MAG: hypothetical protein PHR06_15460 [Candidatus Cloacimonetes bacterium]|nr:hypothetical protein [Candidatus Cloacimonadota bacterium]